MLREARLIRSSPIRSSRSCHDSVNPCRAWARSPTMVKLRDGQRSSSICHSASVSSCASSTTMCANGPASRSGSAVGSAASSTRASWRSCPRSIDITMPSSSSSAAIRLSTTSAIRSRSAASGGLAAGACVVTPPGRRAAAVPRPGAAGRTPSRPGVLALQLRDLVGLEPGSAHPQVGGHRPQVSDEVGRLEQRPRPVEGRRPAPRSARSDLRSRSAETRRPRLVVVLVHAGS